MSRLNYNTKQKDLILNFFKKNEGNLFFAKEIVDKLNNNEINIGLTTIYRFLDNLVQNNTIIIFHGDFGKKYGYFPCHSDLHYHLICTKCGDILHVDCNYFNELEKHLINNHNFKLNSKEIFLKGRCKKCY